MPHSTLSPLFFILEFEVRKEFSLYGKLALVQGKKTNIVILVLYMFHLFFALK